MEAGLSRALVISLCADKPLVRDKGAILLRGLAVGCMAPTGRPASDLAAAIPVPRTEPHCRTPCATAPLAGETQISQVSQIDILEQFAIMVVMIVHSQTRPSTSLRLLCDEAAKHGVSAEACLENTGVSVADLDNPNAVHSTTDEIRAIENLVRLVPENVGLGFAVGRATHVHAFGIWGFAILTSPTLRAAIETAIDYAKLSFLIAEMSLAEENGDARLEFDTTGIPVAAHRYILERHIVIAVKFIRDLLQQPGFDAIEVQLQDDDPAYPAKLAAFTPLPIRIAQRGNALVFPAQVLDTPLPKSDPVSLQFCLDQCKTLLEQQTGPLPPWSQQVRDAIIDKIGTDQQIEDIAARLSVTERTLRRRLTEEGTSFRHLYTDARMVIAHELLASAGLNVETVSWRVGYAEPASFARAFTKKYGKTPGQVRKNRARTAA